MAAGLDYQTGVGMSRDLLVVFRSLNLLTKLSIKSMTLHRDSNEWSVSVLTIDLSPPYVFTLPPHQTQMPRTALLAHLTAQVRRYRKNKVGLYGELQSGAFNFVSSIAGAAGLMRRERETEREREAEREKVQGPRFT